MGMVTVVMALAQPVLSRGHIVSAIIVNVNMVTSIVKVMVMVEVMVSVRFRPHFSLRVGPQVRAIVPVPDTRKL